MPLVKGSRRSPRSRLPTVPFPPSAMMVSAPFLPEAPIAKGDGLVLLHRGVLIVGAATTGVFRACRLYHVSAQRSRPQVDRSLFPHAQPPAAGDAAFSWST